MPMKVGAERSVINCVQHGKCCGRYGRVSSYPIGGSRTGSREQMLDLGLAVIA